MKAALILALLPTMTLAQDFTTQRYTCDRNVEVPATYVNGPDQSLVVIHVEGSQITLVNEPAASGARSRRYRVSARSNSRTASTCRADGRS